MSRRFFLLGLALVVCSCSAQKPGDGAKQVRLSPEYDVYEGYVRDMLRLCQQFPGNKPPILYFGVDGQDPPAEFFQRFRDQLIPVEPASRRKKNDPKFSGLYLSVETPVKWIDENNADLWIHTFNLDGEPEKCGTHFPHHFQRKNNMWEVVYP